MLQRRIFSSCQVTMAPFCLERSGEVSTKGRSSASHGEGEEEEGAAQAAPDLLLFQGISLPRSCGLCLQPLRGDASRAAWISFCFLSLFPKGFCKLGTGRAGRVPGPAQGLLLRSRGCPARRREGSGETEPFPGLRERCGGLWSPSVSPEPFRGHGHRPSSCPAGGMAGHGGPRAVPLPGSAGTALFLPRAAARMPFPPRPWPHAEQPACAETRERGGARGVWEFAA